MPKPLTENDLERSREIIKAFFERARKEEGPCAERVQVLHCLVAFLAQEIVRLENQAEADEKLWTHAINQERQEGYQDGYADGRRRLREL